VNLLVTAERGKCVVVDTDDYVAERDRTEPALARQPCDATCNASAGNLDATIDDARPGADRKRRNGQADPDERGGRRPGVPGKRRA
jgi:hypothetical protein